MYLVTVQILLTIKLILLYLYKNLIQYENQYIMRTNYIEATIEEDIDLKK